MDSVGGERMMRPGRAARWIKKIGLYVKKVVSLQHYFLGI